MHFNIKVMMWKGVFKYAFELFLKIRFSVKHACVPKRRIQKEIQRSQNITRYHFETNIVNSLSGVVTSGERVQVIIHIDMQFC